MTEASNVRNILGGLRGKRLIEITQDDWEDVRARCPNPNKQTQRVHLHFEDGSTAIFYANAGQGFSYDKIPKLPPVDLPAERDPAEGAD